RALSLEPWGHFRPVPRTHVAEPEARPHFFEHRLIVRAALGTMHSWNLGTWNLRPCALSLEPCALYRLPLLDPPPGFFSQAAHVAKPKPQPPVLFNRAVPHRMLNVDR